jgi:peptidoglycan/LPS O-acetylase OafA/YrhL
MNARPPLTSTRLAGFVWLLLAPLAWLGAALSKMDTPERYNIQLGVATVISIVAVGAAFGAFSGRGWARLVLLALSWSSAAFWIYAGVSLSTSGDIEVIPIIIGGFFVLLAATLHVDAAPNSSLPADPP